MGHSKDELLTSRFEKGKGHKPLGPDRTGAHPYQDGRTDIHPAHVQHHVPGIARGMEAQQHTKATLGKPGKPKGYPVMLNGHFNANDADPASPLDGPPRGKRLSPPTINPGCRDRSGDSLASEMAGTAHKRSKELPDTLRDLGRAILDEALNYSAADDRAALANNFGTLPAAVKENT
jgi:hypothetical protein